MNTTRSTAGPDYGPDILAEELMPGRDAQGWVQHPGIEQLLEDGDEDDELGLDMDKVHEAGYELEHTLMYDELDDRHPAHLTYAVDGEPWCDEWEPELPRGAGWRLIAIFDTEDGPCALFARRTTPPADQDKEIPTDGLGYGPTNPAPVPQAPRGRL